MKCWKGFHRKRASEAALQWTGCALVMLIMCRQHWRTFMPRGCLQSLSDRWFLILSLLICLCVNTLKLAAYTYEELSSDGQGSEGRWKSWGHYGVTWECKKGTEYRGKRRHWKLGASQGRNRMQRLANCHWWPLQRGMCVSSWMSQHELRSLRTNAPTDPQKGCSVWHKIYLRVAMIKRWKSLRGHF